MTKGKKGKKKISLCLTKSSHFRQQCNLVSGHYPRYSEAAALLSYAVAPAQEVGCARHIDGSVWVRLSTASSRQHADELGSLQLQLCGRSYPKESSCNAYTIGVRHL